MADELLIESIKKRGKILILSLSDGKSIIMAKTVVDEYGLKIGTALREESIEKLIRESDSRMALDYALNILSRRGYSSGMLSRKMQEKGYSPKVASQTLAELRRIGMLDDVLFARQTVESLLRRKPAGKPFLIAYLQSKLIPHRLAAEVVAEFSDSADETEMAERLLRARWRYLSKFELETARTKGYNYLSRRAIGYRAAKTAFDKLLREENKD